MRISKRSNYTKMIELPKNSDTLQSFLHSEKIATLEQLKAALGTTGTMTVFRRLKALGYLSSYSHRGKYYTLPQIPEFDEQGLWSYQSVWFSRFGNLVATVKEVVEEAKAGWTAQELERILQVEVKRPLLQLYEGKAIHREKLSGVYTYFSREAGKRRGQLLMRKQSWAEAEIGLPTEIEAVSHELKAAIILFFSLLDEQQRRLYAGLEAHKMGHGGDHKIAELLGLDVHTVAKGRRELFGGQVQRGRVRKQGAGRKAAEKKRRRSSNGSSI
jgi:hypothetical protein